MALKTEIANAISKAGYKKVKVNEIKKEVYDFPFPSTDITIEITAVKIKHAKTKK